MTFTGGIKVPMMGSSPMYEGLRTSMNSEPITPIVESQVPKNTLACQDEGAAQDAVDLMHKGNFIMRHQSIRPCVGGANFRTQNVFKLIASQNISPGSKILRIYRDN